jgi:hypothetical protein
MVYIWSGGLLFCCFDRGWMDGFHEAWKEKKKDGLAYCTALHCIGR